MPERLPTAAELARQVADALERAHVPLAGMLALAFDVDRVGGTRRVRVLSDTTRVSVSDEPARRSLVRKLRQTVASWKFSKQRAPSQVTLPLVFERG